MKTISRKDEIVKVAATLFRKRGYSAITMRDIASEMDIKAASLYNHISGKQEILADIILEVAQEFTTGMNQVISQQSSTLKKLENLIELHIDITLNHSEALASLNNDWMHLEGDNLNAFIKMRDEYEDNFRELIKTGIEVNEIRSAHPEVILFSILSTLRTLHLWYEKRGKLDVNVLKKDMVSVLLKGIM
ncbi:TetR/AcrR family transcriptional regulator [Aequorivita sp. 609]|uniref:TetR/AcrR family transcriptional regulator n=1 Tax=Aequorivita TaxID=153265 RepID=UPI0015CFAC36|nr:MULTISPECIES: TetR/AcrR family transcriptional regulator [Aequorivita]MBB6682506.1 TetR/AcrR family transcriptional regulator [Aequorivita sp. 609]